MSLAILRAHAIAVTALGGAALGLGHPNPTDAADNPAGLGGGEAKSQTNRDNRELFLKEVRRLAIGPTPRRSSAG
ncbi:hypothetical protein [Streptomyces sp. NPDC097640]|uniref:hypothetical protein n=1 Tax=Streptomyces sp. NPDC097640 TaxID=3157229 RepID=UPI0033310BF0